MRIFLVTVAFYLVALATFDSVTFNGRYRHAVWQEASFQAQRLNTEVRHVLEKFGILTPRA
jgi:hypothetical protein